MLEIIEDTLIDSIKLLPFLFITYLIMEYIEHKTKDKTKEAIKRSGRFGPLIGGVLGIFPQCGFSVSATNLYAARVITLGTLISVYLSTSDEMLPIFISEAVPISTILKILGVKLIIGIVAGFIIDLVMRLINKGKQEKEKIIDLCEKEHCHCENGIVKSAFKHTINIFIFILIITFLLNIIIYLIVINLIALLAMYIDKQKAKKGKRRIPEKTLFMLVALGGGIGGIAGMYIFRHKTKKARFIVGFLAILILEILIAIAIIL